MVKISVSRRITRRLTVVTVSQEVSRVEGTVASDALLRLLLWEIIETWNTDAARAGFDVSIPLSSAASFRAGERIWKTERGLQPRRIKALSRWWCALTEGWRNKERRRKKRRRPSSRCTPRLKNAGLKRIVSASVASHDSVRRSFKHGL